MVFRNELGDATSKQLRDISPTILIPLGSTEQHGPHLPLDTDTRIATAVARAVTDGLRRRPTDPDQYFLAPAIAYGAAGEHQSFPGTISLGTEALTLVLIEYGRSASDWAGRLIFVNGHGGNVEALRSAVGQLRLEGREVAWCPCDTAGGDAHAGHTETSILLHISPAEVRTEQLCRGNTEPLISLMPQLRRGGVSAVSDVGVLGDPTTATAAEGRRIVAHMVAECLQRIDRWTVRNDGMLL